MIVCVCRRVSERDIRHAVQNGCSNFETLQESLGVSTCCGTCGPCARQVFAEAAGDDVASDLQAAAI